MESDAAPFRPRPDGPGASAAAIHARRASSFGGAAAAYAEHRPDYPGAGIAWALDPVSGQPGRPLRVLDLGAGTGKLTAQLASLTMSGNGVTVVAVEPDAQMLAQLRRRVPGVTALPGRAESIPLPDASVDAVLSGQAMHWFDPASAMPEIARVLVPGGVVAGLWNAEDDRVDWVAGLRLTTGRTNVAALSSFTQREFADDDGVLRWLRGAGQALFGPAEQARFDHAQVRDADSLIETMKTHSMFLIMAPDERAAVLGRVREYLAATPHTAAGEFVLPLQTIAVRAVRRQRGANGTGPGR